MKIVTDEQARISLSDLLTETMNSHQPIHIRGKMANGVLISEDDWRAVEETLYLLAIPGMRESIHEGMRTPIEECSSELSW